MAYRFLFLDYETFSLLNLKEVGLHNYATHPSTGISMLGWALDQEEVEMWLPHAGSPPPKLLAAMKDPTILKIAWNASFEYQITKNKMGFTIPIECFRDPIVLSRNLSLPGSLEQVGEILKLQYRKDPRGDELKDLFCMPANLGKKKGYTPIGTMTLFGKVEPLFRNHISHPKEFAEYGEYCFVSSHKLLGKDLVWKTADKFAEGDTVLGFDEGGPNRKFRQALIEKISFSNEPVFIVTLSSEKQFYVTAEHQWLVSKGKRNVSSSQSLHWVETQNLLSQSSRKDAVCSHIPKILPVWSCDDSYDGGWLSGIFDGEGSFSGRSLTVAQNPGLVNDRIKHLLSRAGFSFSEKPHGDCRNFHIEGGKYEHLRLLGTFQPKRLVSKVDFNKIGRLECRLGVEKVVSIVPAGIQRIIRIQTSTKTLIVDGYPMHNCKQDVRSEREAWYRLVKIPFPETQWKGWFLDQKINERGMPGRRDLAEKALRLATKFVDLQNKALKDLTKLQNPNSDTQFKAWARERGWKLNSLRATSVEAELKNPELKLTEDLRKAFGLRKSARKSSYKKLVKFLALLSTDDYLKYQFSYLGASRTGRWKSGGKEEATNSMQVQNMSRGEKVVKKKLATALKLIEAEDYDGLVREFTNTKDPKDSVTVVEVVITILRSLFQAKAGYTHVVADKNAIENRLLGWAAGCRAILDVFRTCNSCGHLEENLTGLFKCSKCGGEKARDPYLAFGTKMYNKPYEQMWADKDKNEDRQNSKPAVLGAGYGLGGGELYINSDGDEVRGGLWGYAKNVCGVDMPKELAHKAVKVFRDSYPEVLQFWTDMEEAFKQVLRRGGIIKVGEVTWDKENKEWVEHPTQGKQCVLTFRRHKIEGGGYIISMELPSGRSLHYFNATIDEEQKINKNTGLPYTVEILRYDGIEHSATQDASGKTEKKKHKWGRVKTYGGKLVENAIQAMARDDLLESMLLADEMGFLLWGLFHDELAAEVLKDAPLGERLTLDDLIWCMVQIASWAPGLILGAEGFVDEVYHK